MSWNKPKFWKIYLTFLKYGLRNIKSFLSWTLTVPLGTYDDRYFEIIFTSIYVFLGLILKGNEKEICHLKFCHKLVGPSLGSIWSLFEFDFDSSTFLFCGESLVPYFGSQGDTTQRILDARIRHMPERLKDCLQRVVTTSCIIQSLDLCSIFLRGVTGWRLLESFLSCSQWFR